MLHVMFGYRARKHLASTDQSFECFAPDNLDLEQARKTLASSKKKDVILLVEKRGLESIMAAILESRSKARHAVFGYFGSGSGKYVDLTPAADYETGVEKEVDP